jgi:hypothetical protein
MAPAGEDLFDQFSKRGLFVPTGLAQGFQQARPFKNLPGRSASRPVCVSFCKYHCAWDNFQSTDEGGRLGEPCNPVQPSPQSPTATLVGGGHRRQRAVGVKEELSCGAGDNAELVMSSSYEPGRSESPTLLALPIGALDSPANHIAEVGNLIPIQHAGAPFPVTVPVDPKTLAEWATTGFVRCF